MFKGEKFTAGFQWHSYDRYELHFSMWGHGETETFFNKDGTISGVYCKRCSAELHYRLFMHNAAFDGNVCEVDVTDAYTNFFRNMLMVLVLATERQRTKAELLAELSAKEAEIAASINKMYLSLCEDVDEIDYDKVEIRPAILAALSNDE